MALSALDDKAVHPTPAELAKVLGGSGDVWRHLTSRIEAGYGPLSVVWSFSGANVRIRYYGFLANGSRARLLAACRDALRQPGPPAKPDAVHVECDGMFLGLPPSALRWCPACKLGVLRCVQVLERPPPSYRMSPRVAA
jgi:hypothetical protein